MQASASNLKKTVSVLTEHIGLRLAGTEGEAKAARYLATQMAAYTPHVSIEEYPVFARCVSYEHLEVSLGGKWVEFPCSLFSSAASTHGKDVEGEIVFFDTATGYKQPDISYLKGKAVVHLGCHIESEENYRRLMEAAPAFILFVDTRYPAEYALADGLFPAYVAKYGSVPSLNVAYKDAWRWNTEGATKAKINVVGERLKSTTTVVIAELPGTDPNAGVLYAGGHHDTQAATVGADDNAIGSAAVLELTRLLSRTPHKRTLRLISFGAEEQLSVGSASYVRCHRAEIEKNGVFMCNFDSFGSAMGWGNFTVNANPSLREKIQQTFNADGVYYTENQKLVPYTDQFPFAACGVPGIWVSRLNCAAGLFYHHRVDNTIDKIGFDLCAQYVGAAAKLLAFLADTEDISAFTGIPAEMKPAIAELFGAVFGGW